MAIARWEKQDPTQRRRLLRLPVPEDLGNGAYLSKKCGCTIEVRGEDHICRDTLRCGGNLAQLIRDDWIPSDSSRGLPGRSGCDFDLIYLHQISAKQSAYENPDGGQTPWFHE